MRILNIGGNIRSCFSLKAVGCQVDHYDIHQINRYLDDGSLQIKYIQGECSSSSSVYKKFIEIYNIMHNERYDYVITSRKDDMVYVYLASCLLKNKPLLFTSSHNSYVWKNDIKVWAFTQVARLVTDGFFSLATFVSKQLMDFGYAKKRICNLTNPINVKANTRKINYQILDDAPKIAYSAVLNNMKGQHILIDAVSKLIHKYPNIQLNLIGDIFDSEYYKYLQSIIAQAKIQENINILGRVDNQKVLQMLPLQDIYVCPSQMEMCPFNIIEAQISGLPIIASNIGGIPDLLADCAILVPPNDVNILVDQIDYLLSNPVERERLGSKAFARAIDFNSLESVGSYMVNFMKSLH